MTGEYAGVAEFQGIRQCPEMWAKSQSESRKGGHAYEKLGQLPDEKARITRNSKREKARTENGSSEIPSAFKAL